jgi:hypothetical protein
MNDERFFFAKFQLKYNDWEVPLELVRALMTNVKANIFWGLTPCIFVDVP